MFALKGRRKTFFQAKKAANGKPCGRSGVERRKDQNGGEPISRSPIWSGAAEKAGTASERASEREAQHDAVSVIRRAEKSPIPGASTGFAGG